MRFLTICFHALVTAAGSRAIVGLILNTKRMKRRPLPSCAVFYSLSPLRSPEKKVVRAPVVDIFFESTMVCEQIDCCVSIAYSITNFFFQNRLKMSLSPCDTTI